MRRGLLAVLCVALLVSLRNEVSVHAEPPRLLVLTDIGGDPDDQQSMVRLTLYGNEFRIEGFIASAAGTPGELKESVTRPELIQEIIDGYAGVLPQLREHATGWPLPESLRRVIKTGNR